MRQITYSLLLGFAAMAAFVFVHSTSVAVVAAADAPAATQPSTRPANIALNKPATASSTENDEHVASKANDGDDETRWCSDGDSTPQWWQVDLGKSSKLTGCEIRWEFDEKQYQYAVEGSTDGKDWKMLSDQT